MATQADKVSATGHNAVPPAPDLSGSAGTTAPVKQEPSADQGDALLQIEQRFLVSCQMRDSATLNALLNELNQPTRDLVLARQGARALTMLISSSFLDGLKLVLDAGGAAYLSSSADVQSQNSVLPGSEPNDGPISVIDFAQQFAVTRVHEPAARQACLMVEKYDVQAKIRTAQARPRIEWPACTISNRQLLLIPGAELRMSGHVRGIVSPQTSLRSSVRAQMWIIHPLVLVPLISNCPSFACNDRCA